MGQVAVRTAHNVRKGQRRDSFRRVAGGDRPHPHLRRVHSNWRALATPWHTLPASLRRTNTCERMQEESIITSEEKKARHGCQDAYRG